MVIYDALGRMMKEVIPQCCPDRFPVDISDFAAGVYFYELYDLNNGNALITSGKVVLQR